MLNARRFLRDLNQVRPWLSIGYLQIVFLVYENVQSLKNMNSPVCCIELDIERRLITLMHPQINSMIEQFNGRIRA